MTNKRTVETKRIIGTNLYRALAEFETAVRAGWALEPRGTTTVGSVVYINLVRGSTSSGEDTTTPKEISLDVEKESVSSEDEVKEESKEEVKPATTRKVTPKTTKVIKEVEK